MARQSKLLRPMRPAQTFRMKPNLSKRKEFLIGSLTTRANSVARRLP
jgi:hypothetical protein